MDLIHDYAMLYERTHDTLVAVARVLAHYETPFPVRAAVLGTALDPGDPDDHPTFTRRQREARAAVHAYLADAGTPL